MSQQKTTVGQVAACVAVMALICGAAALLTWAKNSATRDVYKAVYSPPTKAEIDEKKAAAAKEVEDMADSHEKTRALARAERKVGLLTWENCWESLSDEAKSVVSLAALVVALAAVVQLFKPRRGW